MSFTLTSSAAIIWKAGEGANSSIIASGAFLAKCCDWAEGRIVAETRKDWVDQYTDVDAGVKLALDDAASSLAAMPLVSYDMSGYAGLAEAETKLDILRDNAQQNIAFLKEDRSNVINEV